MNTHDKGYRGEHELVEELNAYGIEASRIPMSGQFSYTGDVIIIIDKRQYVGEVKSLALGLRDYKLLGHSELIFKRTCKSGKPKHNWLVTMDIATFIHLVNKVNRLQKLREAKG